jgi:hypothetical protein
MNLQKIEKAAELLLQLQDIKKSQSELAMMKCGKVITVETLNKENQYLADNGFNAQSLTTVEECKNNLQQRLISLEITPNSKITADSLHPKLKDTIIAYYMQQGLTINEIVKLIDNCDNHLDTFKILLETKLASNDINYKLQPTNNEPYINLQKLANYLELYITDASTIELIFNRIQELATDNKPITIAAVYNNLKYEFNLTDILLQGIIKILYGNETNPIFHEHKNNLPLQKNQQDETLNIKYNKTMEEIEIEKKEKDARYQQKHQNYLKIYRANGLELEKKHSIAIGSQIADKTGSFFDPHTTIFADLEYADLNGDILNTIDLLHSEVKNHNKFKYIAFTHTPGFIFKDIDHSLTLMLKIYDILQPGGIVMISAGINILCTTTNSNKSFIYNILIPANFLENEIVTLNTHIIYKYETCLSLLNNNNHKFENPSNAVNLIARKV